MKKVVILTLLSLFSVLATAGLSSAISISGGTLGTIPGGAENDLLGGINLSGLYGAELFFTVGEQVTFQFIGEEAGWNNSFKVNGSTVFTNNGSAWGASQAFTVVDPGFNFSFWANSGSSGVYSNNNPDDVGGAISGPNFFVSNLTNDLTLGAGSIIPGRRLDAGIYLWFDDGGAGSDDNHDDMLIRVSSAPAPVPEPATILLMGSGLLGLVGYKRKRFSKNS